MTKANGIPRYVIGEGPLSYEVPVVREHDGRDVATVSVHASGWREALQSALDWALTYTQNYDEKNQPPTRVYFWPEVRYTRHRGTAFENTQRRIAKRIDGHTVWAEQRNQGEGAWLDLGVVFA